jgi:HK97 family phage prohead protease
MKLNLSAGFAIDLEAAAGDAPTRQISGIAVPYNVPATVSDGTKVQFAAGSLPVDGKAPKMFMYHNSSMPVGLVTSRKETKDGMTFVASIVDTQAGTDALTMASAGVLDSVSVGVNVLESYNDKNGTMIVTAADWLELSLVPIPAFSGALVESVFASNESVTIPEEQAPDESEETEPQENPVSEPIIEASAPESIPTSPLYAQAAREFTLPSAGEFMAALHAGGQTFANMNKAVADYTASKRTNIQAAAGDVITTDTPGLLPVPVLGLLVQDLNFLRPVVEALGVRAYPDAGQQKTFVRPTITTHTSVATQSTELSAVSATTMVIAANSVTKTTLAGQVTLSAQDISFTSPAAMQLILNDLMGEYMIASDNFAADNLLTAASASGVWDLSVTDLYKSIFDAASDISTNRNWLPTHMFVSVDVWAQLGQLVDTTGRAIFPLIANGLSGYNAAGSQSATSWNGNPLGLQLVVDSNFAAKTMIVTRVGQGQGDAFEYYEAPQSLMSFENPSVLGRTMSFHGYVSSFAAIPGMIRKITQA